MYSSLLFHGVLLGVLGVGDSCGDCGVLEMGLTAGDLCCYCSEAVRLLPILAVASADVWRR